MRTAILTAELVLFAGLCGLALLGPIAAYLGWRRSGASSKPAKWRAWTASIGAVAVCFQLALLISAWLPKQVYDPSLMAATARLILPVFLIAISLVLTGTGASRRLLASSSVALFILSFFAVLSA